MDNLRSLPATLIIALLIVAVVVLNLVIWGIYRSLRAPGPSSTNPLSRLGQTLTHSPFQTDERQMDELHQRIQQLNPPEQEAKTPPPP